MNNNLLFSRKDLIRLIIPLIIEQGLAILVGMLDVLMVSYAGEHAVNGVSTVDAINMLIITILVALAAGGAIVISQYIGKKDKDNALAATNQLLIVCLAAGVVFMLIALIFSNGILTLMLGFDKPLIFENAKVYFFYTALSFPFLGIYNGCAAIFRAMGNSKVSMKTSLVMNGLNIAGNAILVYSFEMGAEGVAVSTLISRAAAAVIMLIIVRNENNLIYVNKHFRLGFKPKMIKTILGIGVPNGLENGMFQFGKIILQGLISSIGAVAIGANAIGYNLAAVECLPGLAVGVGMITVVGRCVGAGEYGQARMYARKLVAVAYILMISMCLIIIIMRTPLIDLYGLSEEISNEADKLVLLHSIMGILFWPPAFVLPAALRSASDVKYTMTVSVLSMWICRVALAFLFVKQFNMGVFGVWLAMTIDWLFRLAFFIMRFIGTKWIPKENKFSSRGSINNQ